MKSPSEETLTWYKDNFLDDIADSLKVAKLNGEVLEVIMPKGGKDVIEKGFEHSYIVTGNNNHAAIRLYEKLDYFKTDKFGQFKDDETVLCMKKDFW